MDVDLHSNRVKRDIINSLENDKLYTGIVCVNEMARRFCPTSGESGSILMVKNNDNRFEAEGILSFIKGCDDLYFGPTNSSTNLNWQLFQFSTNPTVYTKLYCFLSWIAKQYDLKYSVFNDRDEVHA